MDKYAFVWYVIFCHFFLEFVLLFQFAYMHFQKCSKIVKNMLGDHMIPFENKAYACMFHVRALSLFLMLLPSPFAF